ncbi:MAG: hypothetical protein GC159_11810 [Phycisphaera sp.]|nr:hypothetical protein [Phycisphaera sp.]
MSSRHAFTLVETLVVMTLVLVVISLSVVDATMSRTYANRTICSSNLAGIYTAMYVYSTTNRDKFPTAGVATPGGSATGFREGDRSSGAGAVLDDNVTACLWMMVRAGMTGTKSYVCPSTTDKPDDFKFTATGSTGGVDLKYTFDFLERSNLSYSVINPYSTVNGPQWTADVNPAWVLMADNNANDHLDRHRSSAAAPAADVEHMENSPNHNYDGQNLLFGDAHVSYAQDPYQGPSNDNVFAVTVAGVDAPPSLAHDAGDPANRKVDVTLLPVSGNGGVSLSGLPMDVTPMATIYAARRRQQMIMYAAFAALGVVVLLVYVLIKNRRREQPIEA